MNRRRIPLIWALWLLSLFAAHAFAQRDLPDFTELVEKQGPAVVNISTTQTIHASAMPQIPGMDENDPMFEYFKRFIPHIPRGDMENRSLGSGFLVGSDGYILTNAHVIEAADEIVVKLTDKREFKARVIGTDKRTDVALIKIDAKGLQTVQIGNPSQIKVGEWVVAIGSPFGFENSVTAGIVSAKGRSLPQENFVPFIQTDVAINPGNSGGPLFNMRGEVVGINSQIYSRSGGFMGLSFAIPIDVAMDVQAQLRATGHVQRGRIGVGIQEVTKDLADSFGLQKPRGALVGSVEPNGPADKAGVQVGDIILKFDGKDVAQSADLPRIVAAVHPGSKSSIQVWRKDATRDLTVTLGEWKDTDNPHEGGAPSKRDLGPPANRMGLVLNELSAEQRREMGIKGGVLVEDVRGMAAHSELRPGDVILAVILRGAQTEVRSVDQFNRAVAPAGRNATVTLLVRRGDAQTFITLKGGNGG